MEDEVTLEEEKAEIEAASVDEAVQSHAETSQKEPSSSDNISLWDSLKLLFMASRAFWISKFWRRYRLFWRFDFTYQIFGNRLGYGNGPSWLGCITLYRSGHFGCGWRRLGRR